VSGSVYSTRFGAMCPRCDKPVRSCICPRGDARGAGDGIVRLARETKGRGGKGVTLVSGVPLPAAELEALCRELKRRIGTGGTVKERVIELQGDHRDACEQLLASRGWTVKRAGG